MKYIFYLFGLTLLLYLGCLRGNNKDKPVNSGEPSRSLAVGYEVPLDSVEQPDTAIVEAAEMKYVPKFKKLYSSNNDIHICDTQTYPVTNVFYATPGTDTFILPIRTIVKDSTYLSGLPDVFVSKKPQYLEKSNFSIENFGKIQGLTSTKICCVLKDKEGNLWIGTEGAGVYKYDGKYFSHFTDKQGLASNIASCIIEDKKGNIWITGAGIYNGWLAEGDVVRFDGKYFKRFGISQGITKRILRVFEDNSGNIWFYGLISEGLYKYDGKSILKYDQRMGSVDGGIRNIVSGKNGLLWFVSDKSIISFDGNSFCHYQIPKSINFGILRCVYCDDTGLIWIGADPGGLMSFDGKVFKQYYDKTNCRYITQDQDKNIWFTNSKDSESSVLCFNGSTFRNYGKNVGLENLAPICITADKYGDIWIGSYTSGVYKMNLNSFEHFYNFQKKNDEIVLSSITDAKGSIWLTTNLSKIIKIDTPVLTNARTNAFGTFLGNEKDDYDSCSPIACMAQDKNGGIWFGRNLSLVRYLDGVFYKYIPIRKNEAQFTMARSMLCDDSGNVWYVCHGITKFDGKRFYNYDKEQGLNHYSSYSVEKDKNNNIWVGTGRGIALLKTNKVSKKDNKIPIVQYQKSNGLSDNAITAIKCAKDGNVWIGTQGDGIFMYDGKYFINLSEENGLLSDLVNSITEDGDRNIWVGTSLGLSKLTKKCIDNLINHYKTSDIWNNNELFQNYSYKDGFYGIGVLRNGLLSDYNQNIWTSLLDRITILPKINDLKVKNCPNVTLTGITISGDDLYKLSYMNQINKDNSKKISNLYQLDSFDSWHHYPKSLILNSNENNLTFHFLSIATYKPENIKYKYFLEGLEKDWSALTSNCEANYLNLPSGHFTFRVKAVNEDGNWSKEFDYPFTICPPWWKTWWAYLCYFLLGAGAIFFYIRWRTASLLKRQKELEHTVALRTTEVVEEKKIVEKQKEEVQLKNKEITDNINYAQRIQSAILPDIRLIYKTLEQSFILYLPKDIVSGDFYGFAERDNKVIIIAADCTGHGVSGAFMSMIGSSLLNQVINEKGITEPAGILTQLNTSVIEALNQSNNESNDGMDVSICAFDLEHQKIEYAGANRPLWIARNGEMLTFSPDKYPIGGLQVARERAFTNHIIDLEKGDTIYIFSDGYADQFGGEKGKKLMTSKFKEKLLSIQSHSMREQERILKDYFLEWRGANEQVDDVLVIGVRV